jgi:hypothetical protein
MITIRSIRETCNTTTGTQDFVIPGMGVPKAALFILNNNTGGIGGASSHSRFCIGAFANGENRASGYSSKHGVNPAVVFDKNVNDSCVFFMNQTTGLVEGNANASTITDGVRLIWLTAPSVGAYLNVIFFCGNISTAVGNSDYQESVNVGFRPDQIFVFGTGWSAGGNISNDFEPSTYGGHEHATLSFGFLDGSNGTQACLGINNNKNSIISNVAAFYEPAGDYFIPLETTSTGFTTTEERGTGFDLGYLCIKYNDSTYHGAGFFDTNTGTGNQSITTGFEPQFVFELQSVLTNYIPQSGLTGISHGCGILVAEGYPDQAFSISNKFSKASGGSSTNCAAIQDISLSNILEATNQSRDISSLVSIDTNGYTRNFSSCFTPTTARKWAWLAVGYATPSSSSKSSSSKSSSSSKRLLNGSSSSSRSSSSSKSSSSRSSSSSKSSSKGLDPSSSSSKSSSSSRSYEEMLSLQ